MLPSSTAFSTATAPVPAPATGPLTLADLSEALVGLGDKPLVFNYEGRDTLPGYHVTEVKAADFASLDCGANPETWRETIIQLWDVPAEIGRAPMTAGRFIAITRKVAEFVPFDPQAQLTFEVSDGVAAMQLFAAMDVAPQSDRVTVSLARRPASCKPRDRWLEANEAARATGCCSQSGGASAGNKPCA